MNKVNINIYMEEEKKGVAEQKPPKKEKSEEAKRKRDLKLQDLKDKKK